VEKRLFGDDILEGTLFQTDVRIHFDVQIKPKLLSRKGEKDAFWQYTNWAGDMVSHVREMSDIRQYLQGQSMTIDELAAKLDDSNERLQSIEDLLRKQPVSLLSRFMKPRRTHI